jgi:hypothetical protein
MSNPPQGQCCQSCIARVNVKAGLINRCNFAFARRSRARLRRCDVGGGRRQQAASAWRSGSRSGRARHGDAGDDGHAAAHGQRPAASPMAASSSRWRIRPSPLPATPTTSARWRRSATSPSSSPASSATAWSRPRAKSRAPAAPESTTCASPSIKRVIAELRGHSRTIGGAWVPAPNRTPQIKGKTL